MKVNQTASCSFCSSQKESVMHLYWEYSDAKSIWEKLKALITEMYKTPAKEDPTFYLMGITKEANYVPPFVYLLCTLTKLYIHKRKYNTKGPSPHDLDRHIKERTELKTHCN